MPKRSFTAEEIISKLLDAEVFLSQGQALRTISRGRHQPADLLPLAQRIRWMIELTVK